MFEEKMGSRSNMDDLQAEKERIEKEREKLFAKKEKQLRRINDLDIDDDLYDDLMKSYRAHLSEINEQIANTDNLLYNVEMKIDMVIFMMNSRSNQKSTCFINRRYKIIICSKYGGGGLYGDNKIRQT